MFIDLKKIPEFFSDARGSGRINYAGDSKNYTLSRKSSVDPSKQRRVNSTNHSRKNSVSSKSSAKKSNCSEYENRFEDPKASIQVLSLNLKELTAKLTQKRKAQGQEYVPALLVDENNQVKLKN